MKNLVSKVIVIGAGIFGVSSGLHLARRGVAVTIVNDGPVANGASGRSLSWLNSSRMRSDAYHRLRMAGIDRYRTLAAKHPHADWLSFAGGLTWDGDDEKNEIEAAYRHETSLAYHAVHLEPRQVADMTPGVNAAAITRQGAIFNPGEGWVDLPKLINVMLKEFAALGGVVMTDAGVARVVVGDGRAIGVATSSGRSFQGDAILLATGPSVPKMVTEAGQHIGDATPVSLLVTTKPADVALEAVLNTPRVAVRPAPGGRLALDSAWSEEEVIRKPDGGYEIRKSTLDGLLAEASNVLEGNPRLELEAYGVGRKPIPGDGEPVFGELQAIPGYFVAFSHSGATLGLIAGEMLAFEIATGGRHPMLAPFRPERFAGQEKGR